MAGERRSNRTIPKVPTSNCSEDSQPTPASSRYSKKTSSNKSKQSKAKPVKNGTTTTPTLKSSKVTGSNTKQMSKSKSSKASALSGLSTLEPRQHGAKTTKKPTGKNHHRLGKTPGAQGFIDMDKDRLLDAVEEVQPMGNDMWDTVEEKYNIYSKIAGRKARENKYLRAQWNAMIRSKKPTGSGQRPALISRALTIRDEIEAANSMGSIEDIDPSSEESGSECHESGSDSSVTSSDAEGEKDCEFGDEESERMGSESIISVSDDSDSDQRGLENDRRKAEAYRKSRKERDQKEKQQAAKKRKRESSNKTTAKQSKTSTAVHRLRMPAGSTQAISNQRESDRKDLLNSISKMADQKIPDFEGEIRGIRGEIKDITVSTMLQHRINTLETENKALMADKQSLQLHIMKLDTFIEMCLGAENLGRVYASTAGNGIMSGGFGTGGVGGGVSSSTIQDSPSRVRSGVGNFERGGMIAISGTSSALNIGMSSPSEMTLNHGYVGSNDDDNVMHGSMLSDAYHNLH